MPPHLHPRSRLTTSLFGTTLLVSFLVVGLPHLLPCPAPRTEHADSELASDGRRRRRRRRATADTDNADEGAVMAEGSLDTLGEERKGSFDEGKGDFDEGKMLARKAHECPVPKPGGVIGEVLGFRREDRDAAPGRTTRVETVKRGSDDR